MNLLRVNKLNYDICIAATLAVAVCFSSQRKALVANIDMLYKKAILNSAEIAEAIRLAQLKYDYNIIK